VVGGRGVLLGGVPGVPPGDVNAALIAIGFGADVIMAGQSMDQLRQASARFGRGSAPSSRRDRLWRPCAAAPTSSSARCSCRAPPRRSSSQPRR